MQNLYKYTRFFQPSEIYNDKFTPRFLGSLESFTDIINNDPPPISFFTYRPWEVPHMKKLHNDYYNIIYIFAKICRVKLMWRDLLPPDASTIHQGLWVIGEVIRVQIWIHLADHYFRAYINYKNWIKQNCKGAAIKAGYNDIRYYASKVLAMQSNTIFIYLKNALVNDHAYEIRLENYIKEMFDLDYKNYNTDSPEYDHAVSKKFHHKRMLL